MATSDFALLTVENTGGALALKRKSAAEVVPETASPIYGEAAGNPAVFSDAAGERVFRSAKANIEPVQAGTGDPLPDNVRPISGWTVAKVTRCGKNLLDYETAMSAAGFVKQGDEWFLKNIREVNDKILWENTSGVNGKITLTYSYKYSTTSSQGVRFAFLYSDGERVDNYAPASTTYAPKVITSNAQKTLSKIIFTYGMATVSTWIKDMQIELGSTATEYEPYTGETHSVEFPSEAGTVYGGTLDLTAGTLTVDRAYISLTGAASEPWAKAGSGDGTYFRMVIGAIGSVVDDSGICSHFAAEEIAGGTTVVGQRIFNSSAYGAVLMIRPEDAADATVATFKAWLAEQAAANTPVQMCWKLTEPGVYTMDAGTIAALAGLNSVFADCGPVEIEYVRDTGAAIEAANADTRAMIGEASGETASRSLAVGEYVTVGAALYRVTAAVGQGETLVPGTNVTETTVGAELVRLAAMLAQ